MRVHYDVIPVYPTDEEKLACAQIKTFLILPRHERQIYRTFDRNTAAFSLITGIDSLVLTPLRDSERNLFCKALRMLQSKVLGDLFPKNVSSRWKAATVDMTGSGTPKSSDKQPLRLCMTEGHGEWLALMLLGPGEFETFPVHDYDGV